ncbi:hypothetical protein LXA43DRAFT_1185413, partial [Ganoderma leucocontextum]
MPRVDNLPFPQPLEANFTHPSPCVVSAYSICYLAERVVDPIQDCLSPRDESVKTKLINIRILGYLLSQSRFLSDRAISEVARGIISCRKDPVGTDETDVEELNKLGEFYKNHLLWPFRKFRGQTPISSPSSDVSSSLSECSFQLTEDEVDQMLAETPKSCTTSRKLAMQREDHRCIATRILDLPFAEDLHDLTGEVYKGIVASLEVCHIFTESNNIKGRENEHDNGGNAWALLESLGYTNIVGHFATVDKVHSLDNVMMMVSDLRNRFDILSMWFEPIEDVRNRYRICSIWDLPYGLVAGQEVTFQSTNPRLPLPNREYLRIHAACCRVAHLSGAAGLFNELEKDMDSDPGPTTQVSLFPLAET